MAWARWCMFPLMSRETDTPIKARKSRLLRWRNRKRFRSRMAMCSVGPGPCVSRAGAACREGVAGHWRRKRARCMIRDGPLFTHQELEPVDVAEGNAGATCHGAQGVLAHVYGQFRLDADALVQATKQSPAAGEVDARAVDVRAELGRGAFQGAEDRLFDLADRFVQG